MRSSTIHVTVGVLVAAGLFATMSARAQEFSASMISTDQDGAADTSHVYLKAGLLRLEATTGGKAQMAEILDNARHTVTTLDLSAHRYITTPLASYIASRGTSPLQAMLQPTGANPCDYWNGVMRAFSSAKGSQTPPTLSCSDAGADKVDGRAAEHWRVANSANSQIADAWIDRSLGFVTRFKDEESGIELRHLTEGTQPDSLFRVPAAYTKIDAATMTPTRPDAGTKTSTSNGVVEKAGKTLGKDAAAIAAKAARQKADSSMAKKARKIFHIP